MPQFKYPVGGIDIEDDVIKMLSEKIRHSSCAGFRCDTCPLSTTEPGDGTTCGWMQAEGGNTEHLTKLQKEILACVAIFGRYPLEGK